LALVGAPAASRPLCADLLVLCGLHGDVGAAREAALAALHDGRAAERFGAMVAELGGPADLVDAPSRHLPGAPVVQVVEPRSAGVVFAIDVRAVGIAIVNLGGGRAREDDVVDHSVGLTEVAALGERVEPGGRPLALVHAADEDSARRAADAVRSAYAVSDGFPDVLGPVAEIQRTV
jgi:thymidine phosphorylase